VKGYAETYPAGELRQVAADLSPRAVPL
jgi:hypothetical protein